MPRTCRHHTLPRSTFATHTESLLFDQWGMDIVGKLSRAPEQREYFIVAVDYFSKWVEAEALSKISAKEVMKFFWKDIVCRFGIPRAFLWWTMAHCSNERNFAIGVKN
ncbi:UNVERIFIED_CONTAM: hypothetical protein Sradi_6241700 [Sesamum radiatum]|uniref:Reverse transcriptase domain-containing protein n=1 Tax=Sesamum radiatum TaxID=300843 RepID=A0AAW2KA60_SESRA